MKKFFTLLSILTMSVFVTSCGKKVQIVSDVDVETRAQDNIVHVVTDFKLDVGQAELPEKDGVLPSDYGTYKFYRVNDENRIEIDLNLTEILKIPSGLATLPNGALLPIDTRGAVVVEFPLERINGKIYIGHDGKTTMVGVAFGVKQLEDVADELGGIGVYPNYSIGGFNVTAGIYPGNGSGVDSGIAIFANLGGGWNEFGEAKEFQTNYNTRAFRVLKTKRLSRRSKRKLYRSLRRVLKTKQVLTIE
jgi:hypothetical protein